MGKNFIFLPIVVVVILIQLLTAWIGSAYYLTQLTMSAYYSLLIVGLCVLMGYAGQISLGHAGFFAIGGYISAALTTRNLIPYANNLAVRLLDSLGCLQAGKDVYGDPLLVVTPWVACILAILRHLIDSRVGRALRAIHGSPEAADAMGVDTARFKLQTFMLSAVFSALAGVLLTHYNGGIRPSEASVMKSVRYVAIVAVGGMANLWGALAMGMVLNFLSLRGFLAVMTMQFSV